MMQINFVLFYFMTCANPFTNYFYFQSHRRYYITGGMYNIKVSTTVLEQYFIWMAYMIQYYWEHDAIGYTEILVHTMGNDWI